MGQQNMFRRTRQNHHCYFTWIFQLITYKISLTLLERLQHGTASNLENQHKSDLCIENMINSNVNDLNTL